MKPILLYTIATLCIITACRQKTAKQKLDIYPISAILQENAKKVDSAFKTFTYYKTNLPQKDSLTVDNTFFKNFAAQFYAVDLTADKFKTQYEETNFQDESMGPAGSATFTYKAINTNAPFSSMQIAVNRATQNYIYAYLAKTEKIGDTLVNKKLSWFFTKSAIVTSTYSVNGITIKDVIEKIVWRAQ